MPLRPHLISQSGRASSPTQPTVMERCYTWTRLPGKPPLASIGPGQQSNANSVFLSAPWGIFPPCRLADRLPPARGPTAWPQRRCRKPFFKLILCQGGAAQVVRVGVAGKVGEMREIRETPQLGDCARTARQIWAQVPGWASRLGWECQEPRFYWGFAMSALWHATCGQSEPHRIRRE